MIMSNDKSYLETLDLQKPESFEDEIFVPVKSNLLKKAVIFSSILMILILAMLLILNQKTTVPDMTGWTTEQVEAWSEKNHKNIELISTFNNEIQSGYLVSQSIAAGEKIASKTPLIITISNGADPNETVMVPNLRQISVDEIKKWIEDNKLSNTVIRYENHGTIPDGQLIDYEFVDGSTSSFLRKNRLNIYVSSGEKGNSAVVTLPDFSGKNSAEAHNWGVKNGVTVTIKNVFNETVPRNNIISQSVLKDSKMKVTDVLIIEVSRGKEIVVPDFYAYTRQEANDLAGLLGLKVFFKYENADLKEEIVYNQSVSPLDSVDETEIVTLYISKKMTDQSVPDFIGLTEQEAKSLAQLMNVKIFIKNSTSSSEGIIKNQSHLKDEMVSENTIIYLEVDSDSTLLTVPDFSNMRKVDAEVIAENMGLKIIFNEFNATVASHNTVVGQSIKASEKVLKGATIKLDLIVNSGITVPNFENYTKNEVEIWAQKQNVTLKLLEMYSEEIPRGRLFGFTKKNKVLLKNEPLVVYYSLGRLNVPDFVGKSKEEVVQWMDDVNQKGASITVKFSLDYHSTKPRGAITFQSNYNDVVDLNKELTFHVSAVENHGVQVPVFKGLNVTALTSWCQQNGILYNLTDQYNDVYEKDIIFDQNYNNSYISKEGILNASRSLGKVYIPSFVGKTKEDVHSWINEANLKGADIQVIFSEQSSAEPKGTVILQSVVETYVKTKSTLEITLSNGH